MRNEEPADLQRYAGGAAAREEGHDDHAVRHELRGDGEEPDRSFLAALVLVRGVAEGDEESREEGEVGPVYEGRVAPGHFVEDLSRLASPLLNAEHAKERQEVKRCRVLKTTRASMGNQPSHPYRHPTMPTPGTNPVLRMVGGPNAGVIFLISRNRHSSGVNTMRADI